MVLVVKNSLAPRRGRPLLTTPTARATSHPNRSYHAPEPSRPVAAILGPGPAPL